MVINIEQTNKNLNVSYLNERGETKMLKINIPQSEKFVWEITTDNDPKRDKEWTTWNNLPVRKKHVSKLDKYRILEIIEKLDPNITNSLWKYVMPPKYFIDIEVEITDNRADALDIENTKNKIISIAIANTDKKITVLGLDDLSYEQILNIEKRINEHFKNLKDKWIFNYKKFESEYDMIYTFLGKLIHKMPLITGWNWFGYDWPYIINRAKKLGINPNIASPSKVLVGKNQIPLHILMIDYLEIYKKWDHVIKIKESNSLNYVAEQAIGLKKISYNGSLKELYDKDLETFIFYNAIDSALIYYIDKKLNTIATFLKIAYINRIEINKALSPVSTAETLVLRKFLERKKVIIHSEKKEKENEIKYEGAFVKQPQRGLHEWVACFDFASLYPNIMIQWEISPENYLGKNIEKIPENVIKTYSGAIFKKENNEAPVLKEILTDLYDKRREVKKKYFECQKEIEKIEKIIEKKEIEDSTQISLEELKEKLIHLQEKADDYHNEEQAIKRTLNSIYGAVGNNYFVLFNSDVAESVTKQGKDILHYTEKIINEYFNEIWYQDKDLHEKMNITDIKKINQDVVIYGDTDSNYINFGVIYNSCKTNIEVFEFIKKIYELRLKEYIQRSLDEYAKKWNTSNRLNFEWENLSYNGIFIEKKKYVLEYAWVDPNKELFPRLTKIKSAGIELAQSGTPPFAREKITFLLKYIFEKGKNFNIKEFIKLLKKVKEEFKIQMPEKISIGIVVNNMEKFVINDTNTFEVTKGCPIHVRAAGYYNYLLNNSKYKSKYNIIRSSDKINFYYVNVKNEKENDVFAYLKDSYPFEFAPSIDYNKQFDRTILEPINRFIVAMGYDPIAPNLLLIKTLF